MKCEDCEIAIPEGEDRYLEPHADGPFCVSCWSAYPTEDETAEASHER